MSKGDKSAVVQILALLGFIIMVTFVEYSGTGFQYIQVTTCFLVYNLGNTSAMRFIFLFKMFTIWFRFQKCCKKSRENFMFLRWWHFNCLCGAFYLYEENTCHRQSMYSKTVLRLLILLKGTFFNSIVLKEKKQYDTGAAVQISAAFGTL